MEPGTTMSKENDVMPSTATSEENEIITSMEGDTVMSKENGMMTTSTMEPVMPIAKDVEVMTTYTTIPGVTTPDVADMINIATKDFSNSMPTLVKDLVTTEEHKLLVRWMHQHCAAGNTSSETPAMHAFIYNNAKRDVQRQFMTKLEVCYEIKNYFAETSEQLNVEVTANRLRSEEMKNLEEKMLACMDEVSDRFGFQGNSYATMECLKSAVAWCMKP
ncbi:uncharacterized protein IUM83_12709 [Phytophthora cinnamomi]|uniref:uncharacterized protein n=1 Tax=Phytophthora cinnamomi TaxID=4785 RepID=UPI00355AA097|nr:hypothetical protein IUM83_12709 [Phytophthora cinnamomi]